MTGGVRAAAKAASANGTVPTIAAASTGEVDAHTTTIGDAATMTDHSTVCQATPTVTGDISTAAAADGGPPCDRDDTLDTRGGAGARNVTAVSEQTGAIADTKDVTDDARNGAGREELGTRVDFRVAAATTDSVTDTHRERATQRGAPERLLCVLCALRGLGGSSDHLDSCPHQLHLPCYVALRVRATTYLRCPACRATVTVEEADRQALRQHSEEVMAEAMIVARRERRGVIHKGLKRWEGKAGHMQHLPWVGGGDRLRASPCCCDVHRRCALGFVEDAILRARANEAGTVTHQVTCPNPALHEVH